MVQAIFGSNPVGPQGGGGFISVGNSTTATLAATGTSTGSFVGAAEDVSGFSQITVFAYTDTPSTTDGLKLEFSTDGTNWDRSKGLSVNGGQSQAHALAVASQYFRVQYFNGATAQTQFRLQTIYHTDKSKHLTSSPDENIGSANDVELMRVSNNYGLDISRNIITNKFGVAKFGRNPAIDNGSAQDIWFAGGLRAWQTTAEAYRIAAGGNEADGPTGTGARVVVIQGLDSSWNEASSTLIASGTAVSTATDIDYIRLNRAFVSEVGTYHGYNIGTVNIETTSSLQQAGIQAAHGQTQISHYSVPASSTAYLLGYDVNVEGAKNADVTFYQYVNADDVTVPNQGGRRVIAELNQKTGPFEKQYWAFPSFPSKTDLWWEGTNGPAAGAAVSVDYDLWVVTDETPFTP